MLLGQVHLPQNGLGLGHVPPPKTQSIFTGTGNIYVYNFLKCKLYYSSKQKSAVYFFMHYNLNLNFNPFSIYQAKPPNPPPLFGTLPHNYDVILYGKQKFIHTPLPSACCLRTTMSFCTENGNLFIKKIHTQTWTLYRECSYTKNFFPTAKVS